MIHKTHPLQRIRFFFASPIQYILLLGVLGACSSDELQLVKFSSSDNFSLAYKTTQDIQIKVGEKDLQQVDLQIGTITVASWKNPKKDQVLSHRIDSEKWGVGTKKMTLFAVKNNAKTTEDQQNLIVLSDIQPQQVEFSIVETFPHNINNFTQGLEFDNDQLYESTGQQGQSKLSKINIDSGEDIAQVALESTHFGEGITILGDTIYQLTWTTNTCFLYNKQTLERFPESFSYSGEGWGICNDGTSIITSDGSERLTFRDPRTFEIQRVIEVYTHQQVVTHLNELEYINGFIFANIWMTNNIAIIDPPTGRVVGVVNGTPLVSIGRGKVGDSFNGIAYHKNTQTIFLTGKNWEKMFQITLKNFFPPVS